MASSLFGRQNNPLGRVKSMMQAVQMASDPKGAMEHLAQSNPQIGAVMQACQGKSPKDVFYAQCKQTGIDPESVLDQLR